ncbi:MAG: hypothetical protein ACC618_03085 [Patescibacteria group bacterium]
MTEKNIDPLRISGPEVITAQQLDFVIDLANYKFKCVVWDLDETLGDTQTVVKAAFDKALGTNYSSRVIDRFDALSHWAAEDGITTYEEASVIETQHWISRHTLSKVAPFPKVQDYSRKAAERGKIQYIVTSRRNQLKEVTINWVREYYGWIPVKNIKVTPRRNLGYDSEFKTKMTSIIKPDFVFEDNLDHVLEILEATPETTRIIWFSRELEADKLKDSRVLTLPGGQEQFGQLMSHNIDTSQRFL